MLDKYKNILLKIKFYMETAFSGISIYLNEK